jgi:hypothetical protein
MATSTVNGVPVEVNARQTTAYMLSALSWDVLLSNACCLVPLWMPATCPCHHYLTVQQTHYMGCTSLATNF